MPWEEEEKVGLLLPGRCYRLDWLSTDLAKRKLTATGQQVSPAPKSPKGHGGRVVPCFHRGHRESG